jgi:hypothetical protein
MAHDRFMDPQRYQALMERAIQASLRAPSESLGTPRLPRLWPSVSAILLCDDACAASLPTAAIAEALRRVQEQVEWAMYSTSYSTQSLLEILRGHAATPASIAGHICEVCFDAPAVTMIPETQEADAYGICHDCHKRLDKS